MNPIKKFVYYTLQVMLGVPCAILDIVFGYRPATTWALNILDKFIENEKV